MSIVADCLCLVEVDVRMLPELVDGKTVEMELLDVSRVNRDE